MHLSYMGMYRCERHKFETIWSGRPAPHIIVKRTLGSMDFLFLCH